MNRVAYLKRTKLTEFDDSKDVKEFLEFWTRNGDKPPTMTVTKSKKGYIWTFFIETIVHRQPKLHRPL